MTNVKELENRFKILRGSLEELSQNLGGTYFNYPMKKLAKKLLEKADKVEDEINKLKNK